VKIRSIKDILGWPKAAQDAVMPHLERLDMPAQREAALPYRDISLAEQNKQRLEGVKIALEDGDIEAAKRLLEDIKL
jgi:hypothetical protein